MKFLYVKRRTEYPAVMIYPMLAYFIAGLTLWCGKASAITSWTLLINTNNIIIVTNAPYNAKNDGVTDNTRAVSNAIVAAAKGGLTNGGYGGTVRIPAPGVYMCGPLILSSYVNLQIDAGATLRMQPLTNYPGTDVSPANFISASTLHDIAITGSGVIDGQGEAWWRDTETNSAANRPLTMNLTTCTRVLVQDITCSNSPAQCIVIKGKAGSVIVERVKIYAPPSSAPVNPSHNTDGIDLAETNAVIRDCTISTGDDNIAIGSSASVSADILVTNCVFGDGHGCSIGSYTSGGVSNLTVINCSFTGTDNGIRLKSQRGRGGVVQNCNYYNLPMTNVDWPLLIYSYYEFGLGTITPLNPAFAAYTYATNPTTLGSTTPIWRNITFSNINATVPAGRPPLMVWGLPEAPASNIVFRSVAITSSSSYAPGIYNATNLQFIDCSFNLPAGITNFQLWNTQLTVTNSSPATNVLWFDGLTTNGLGNVLALYNASASLNNTNAFDDGPLTLSGSTLTVTNPLVLFPSTVLNFFLGTNSATLAVVGNLTLGGTNNISAGSGFTNGTYTLMTCTGTLGGSLPKLGSVPAGYNYSFDTNTAGQVKLNVGTTNVSTVPTNFVAVATNMLINLRWNPVSGATTYNLKRGTANGGPYPTVYGGLTTTNYADANVTNTVTYYYVVTSVAPGGESSNSLQVIASPLPSNRRTNLSGVLSGDSLVLSWPQDHIGWRLQMQTNRLGTNWVDVPGSTLTNVVANPVNPADVSEFYRIVYP